MLSRLQTEEAFKKLSSSLKKQGHKAKLSLSTPLKPYLLVSLFATLKRKILVVTSDPKEAEELTRDITNFLEPISPNQCVYFPPHEVFPHETIAPDKEAVGKRLKILNQLLWPDPIIVVTTLSAAKEILPARPAGGPTKERLFTPLKINVGEEINLDETLQMLVDFDYERTYMVEKKGQFSVRGGIIDIYATTENYPVRVELVGDKVASVRTFSLATQRSIALSEEVVVFPAREDGFSGRRGAKLFDYLPSSGLVVWNELARLEGKKSTGSQSVLELSSLALKDSPFPSKLHPLFTEIGRVTDFGRLQVYLKDLAKEKYLAVLVVEGKGSVERLQELFKEWELPLNSARIVLGTLGHGFIFPPAKLAVLTETDIYGHRKERRQERQTKARSFFDLMDLEKGDYVVHVNHGIGRYQGLKEEVVDRIRRDYLVVEYAMGDKLYVPTDQMGLVQKYVGGEGVKPTIYRLGGKRWQQVKRKVRVSARRLAAELLRLYAERKSLPGYAFSKDTPWQRELEDAFPFKETLDQLEAINEIKQDMEIPSPMDRLVCGDVGYGKTEVAIRAAFKAVLDGKQVAVLVPTTILALQHFTTFRTRFAAFPIVVEVLSRLRSKGEQIKILEGLEKGTVDVIIGTHRLLQKDVKFKHLGLVIIDEEQRFGVRHKESLKELRRQVDVATLSATPIPRTLNMSLLGVRDMSVIDTPPEDRYPVTTFVGRHDEEVMVEAVKRELARGGQVFFVHNRVETIERVAERLRSRVPEARIAVAHGQMDEKSLERVMLDFVAQQYDVLVATTIIENGLDIPTVNTLIVDRADRLGLAQLYQLRGRVGRADLRSSAYFFYPSGQPLNRAAYERLKTIAEFTELGSGFRIALRDLEIRGAGNLLGEEQHGFINAVGFELYAELLREAVERLKGEVPKKKIEVRMELPIEAYIPKDYIEDEVLRVDTYRRIALLDEEEKMKEMADELKDRYGEPPQEVENLFSVVFLKLLAEQAGINRIVAEGKKIRLKSIQGKATYVEMPEAEKVVSLLREVLCDIMAQN